MMQSCRLFDDLQSKMITTTEATVRHDVIATVVRQHIVSWTGEVKKSEWKQSLKKKFDHITQFARHDSHQRKSKWKEDLIEASRQVVEEVCPKWQVEESHRKIHDKIQAEVQKGMETCPRRDWLYEKACAWLQSLASEVKKSKMHVAQQVFDPGYTIKIAYHIFLRGAGNFEPFVKYLERRGRNNETIKQLIQAHNGSREQLCMFVMCLSI